MRTNITYLWVFSFLLAGSLIRAQNRELIIADSLFAKENFSSAATAFERAYFFSPAMEIRVAALFKRAQCFKMLGRNTEAYNSLVRINKFELDDSTRCAANYELALHLYLDRYFNDARTYCEKNYSLPVNTPEYQNTLLLHGLVLNELNKYKEAHLKLKEYISTLKLNKQRLDSLDDFIASAYDQHQIPKLKSLKKARRLSKILPGAGLFYAGKPGKALANIGFQLLAATYTGVNIYFHNYVTSASAGVFLLRAFYTGGINQLNEVIPAVNYSRSRNFNDHFRNTFINKLKDGYAH